MLTDNNPFLVKGRFIIQEIEDRKNEKFSRHESISMNKKVFMKTHYKAKPVYSNTNEQQSLNYSTLVYDHSSGKWADFDSIWYLHQGIKDKNDYSFSKIFHYLYGDTEHDSSHLKSNEENSARAPKEMDKGMLKDYNIRKPKSQTYIVQNQTKGKPYDPYNHKEIKNELYSCVENESFQFKGEIDREKKLKRKEKLFPSSEISFLIGKINE